MRGYRDSLSHGDGQLRWDHPFVSQDVRLVVGISIMFSSVKNLFLT